MSFSKNFVVIFEGIVKLFHMIVRLVLKQIVPALVIFGIWNKQEITDWFTFAIFVSFSLACLSTKFVLIRFL